MTKSIVRMALVLSAATALSACGGASITAPDDDALAARSRGGTATEPAPRLPVPVRWHHYDSTATVNP